MKILEAQGLRGRILWCLIKKADISFTLTNSSSVAFLPHMCMTCYNLKNSSTFQIFTCTFRHTGMTDLYLPQLAINWQYIN